MIFGHSQVRERLRATPAGGAALLFSGPPSLGKRLTAVWYATLLNCAGDGEAPCTRCPSCRKIESGNHPDVRVMEREEGRQSIGVGEVRGAIAEVSFRPFEARVRVWIVAEAERLTEEAQNCLLKTLEEPPARLVIVLVCSAAGSLLPTVVSRCRPFHFRPVDPAELVPFLVSRGAQPDHAATLAHLSGGRPGKALALLADPQLWDHREAILDLLGELPGAQLWGALQCAAQLESLKLERSEGRAHLEQVLEVAQSWFRDLTNLAAGGPEEETLNIHRLAFLRGRASQGSPGRLVACQRRILEAQKHLQLNVNSRLLLQRLCLCLAREG